MRLKIIFILFFLCLFHIACSKSVQNPKIPGIDGLSAYLYVSEIVSIGTRPSGSQGAEKTVEYIVQKARKTGLPVKLDKWQAWTPCGKITFRNVIVEIKGRSNDFIIIGSHYDTKRLISIPNFSGANDGASGAGLLLHMIEHIKKSNFYPPFSLRFVFFDGEECFINYSETDGLFGSRRMLQKLKSSGEINNCKAVIILDMVGDRNLCITLPSKSNEKLAAGLLSAAHKQNTEKYFKCYHTDIIDDHVPFQENGIPSIDIIDFEFGPSNRYWHTEADTLEKISPESLEIIGNTALRLILEFEDIQL